MRRVLVIWIAMLSIAIALPAFAQAGQQLPAQQLQNRPVQGVAPPLGPAPDLRVTRVLVNKVECPDSLCLGVHIEMRNYGEGTKGPVDVRLSYKTAPAAPWTPLETFRFAPQAHNHDTGAGKRFSFRATGDYCFLAEIDPENKVQPAAATKARGSDCQHYEAGIPDPVARGIRIARCQHDNTNASHCFGELEVQNVGDGKLDGNIKVEFKCAANGGHFEKLESGFEPRYRMDPNDLSSRPWVVTVKSKDVQTLRCTATLYPSMRERSSANNSITSDLWRKP